MPTNNPKVSAYIPQYIFDRFKQFYEEQDISMSQAVAVIFAEYFQLDHQVNHSSSVVGGVTLARMEALEQGFLALKSTSEPPSSLLDKVQNLEDLLAQTIVRLSDVEARQVINSASEPISKLQDELLTEPEVTHKEDDSAKQLSITDETDILLLEDRQPDELESQHQVSETEIGKLPRNLFSGLPVELTLQELALRLGTTAGTLNTKKFRCNGDIEKFYNWLQTKDPDKIRWIESGSRGRAKLYKFDSSIPDELLSGLKE